MGYIVYECVAVSLTVQLNVAIGFAQRVFRHTAIGAKIIWSNGANF